MLKPILNTEKLYVTSDGEIYILLRKGIKKVNAWETGNGYLFVHTTNKNIRYQRNIHRIVAETFIPNPDNKPQVAHKNGNRKDNRVENLYWATAKENEADKIKHFTKLEAEKHPRAKHNNKQIRVVKWGIKIGTAKWVLAKLINGSINDINKIKRGEAWKTITI